MFVNIANAATETTAAVDPDASSQIGGGLTSFIPMILILVVFYFLLLRPQMKKQKELSNMVTSLKVGDKVVAAGGMIGIITKIEDDVVHIETSKDVIMKVVKQSVTDKLNKDNSKAEASKDKVVEEKKELKVESKVSKKKK